jgi:3-phenylpropionate/trans-cinnamate dioxygenase ferredoxin subunit
MAKFIEAINVNDLNSGEMKDVVLDGREILLARVGGSYYAADNRCPHLGGKLSRGRLEGTVVTCPLHGSQFDLASGKVIRWLKGSGLLSSVGKALKGPRPIATYGVKVESDKLLVEI